MQLDRLAGLILAVTIIGLPWTPAAFRIAGFSAWPFGRQVIDRSALGDSGLGACPVGLVLNILWFVFAGWWLAIAALASCVLGYIREYKGPLCLLGVVPSALYVANPFSVMVFVKFVGN